MTPRFPRSLLVASAALFAAAFALAQDAHQLPANHLLLHALQSCRKSLMRTACFGPGFVEGHDFSRAVRVLIRIGFSRCGSALNEQ